MSVQLSPAASQRIHWRESEVGESVHVPLSDASRTPTVGAPARLMCGSSRTAGTPVLTTPDGALVAGALSPPALWATPRARNVCPSSVAVGRYCVPVLPAMSTQE